MHSRHRFPKSIRLLTSEQYSDVFQAVDVRVSSRYFLILARKKNLPEARMGLIVAKKNIKLSVQRNRIKRLLRESFRLRYSSLPKLDIIVLAKKGLDECSSSVCAVDIQCLWDELSKKAQ